jgi:UDP-N-acetylglucosamine diphosphorylase / glucose-1-phosphate thymidylyltransferase / UDP-N-acetylgalactosamine diphosphorylase / glucosamine-1-phosphate N-acetyltransferase / galactosamine-1-phosphate N-acetyltransferase
MKMFKPSDLFDLSQSEHAALFDRCEHAWDALKNLKAYIDARFKHPPAEQGGDLAQFKAFVEELTRSTKKLLRPGVFIGDQVLIGEGTVIEDGVMIKGPAIIGRNCELRHNAYIREHVIIGDNCVIGNACEFKHSLLFNHANVPHFSYVGDSILGYKAHLGAGVKISNVKLMPGNVKVLKEGMQFDTGLRKFGAMLGDHTDIGCNSVLNPGSVIGRGSVIYPCTNWRGVLPANSIVKNLAKQEITERRAKT